MGWRWSWRYFDGRNSVSAKFKYDQLLDWVLREAWYKHFWLLGHDISYGSDSVFDCTKPASRLFYLDSPSAFLCNGFTSPSIRETRLCVSNWESVRKLLFGVRCLDNLLSFDSKCDPCTVLERARHLWYVVSWAGVYAGGCCPASFGTSFSVHKAASPAFTVHVLFVLGKAPNFCSKNALLLGRVWTGNSSSLVWSCSSCCNRTPRSCFLCRFCRAGGQQFSTGGTLLQYPLVSKKCGEGLLNKFLKLSTSPGILDTQKTVCFSHASRILAWSNTEIGCKQVYIYCSKNIVWSTLVSTASQRAVACSSRAMHMWLTNY